jgi:transposase
MEEWVQKLVEAERRRRKEPLEVKTLNNNHYLYHSTTRWDKKEKKVKKVTKYIGRLTPDGVVHGTSKVRTIHEYGNAKLLMDLSSSITGPLERSFYRRWKDILACSIVKAIEPLPLKLIKSRWEKLHLSGEFDASLSPNTLSAVLREIGADYAAQKRFFDKLMMKSRTLAFDLSQVFSHSENLHYAEKGYNKDHSYLKQVNLMMFFSIDRHLPVMLKPLHGSVRDIKALKSVIADLDVKGSIFVLDRGFASDKLQELFNDREINFILPLRRNFKSINYGAKLGDYFVYMKRGIRWARCKSGHGFIYLFEDVKMKAEEETTFIQLIKDGKRQKSQYTDATRKFGKIAIASNLDISGERIYSMLKDREDIEAAFDALKNDLENDKTYLGDDDALRGYFFVSFLSLYLHYCILKLIRRKKLTGKMSAKEVLLELSKVYQISVNGKKSLCAIPNKVEELIELLNIDINPKNLGS